MFDLIIIDLKFIIMAITTTMILWGIIGNILYK